MCRVFKLEILESPEVLESLLKDEKDVRKRERLQFLYWHKTGQAKTRQALGGLLNRSQFTLGQWANIYRTKGLRGLLYLNYRGGNLAPSIPVAIQWQLKEQLNVEMPITDEVYKVLFKNKSPKKALNDLMTRELKDEV